MMNGSRGKKSRRALAFSLLALACVAGLSLAVAQRRRAAGTDAQTPRTLTVKARGNLQQALDDARPGDTILVEAGATFVGPFTLPYKKGTNTDADWITIRTNAPDGSLPAAGQRVTPAHAPLMPKLLAPGNATKALQTAPGAHHYRVIGIEFAPADAKADVRNIVWLSEENNTPLERMPHHITLDRCYVHGLTDSEQVRGVALNGSHMALINSHVSEIHHTWQDSQAVWGSWGAGPYLIENNYLEAAGENLMFGGDDPSVENLVPSDITIRRNHFTKPEAWREGSHAYAGRRWAVKNLLELKNARRVLIEGNLFEGSWRAAQTGVALLLKGTNQYGRATWSVCEDVTVRNNVIRRVGTAIQLAKEGNSQGTKKIRIINNLIYDVSRARYAPNTLEGCFLGTQIEADDVLVEHNTVGDVDHKVARLGDENYPKHRGLIVRNNLWMRGEQMGWGLEAQTTEGVWAFRSWGTEWVYERNAMFGPTVSAEVEQRYPPGNFFSKRHAREIFVDAAGGDYRLRPDSPYKARGTDGKDLGCDLDALEAATGLKLSGATSARPSASPSQRPRRVVQP